jgi:hypothetical protein
LESLVRSESILSKIFWSALPVHLQPLSQLMLVKHQAPGNGKANFACTANFLFKFVSGSNQRTVAYLNLSVRSRDEREE